MIRSKGKIKKLSNRIAAITLSTLLVLSTVASMSCIKQRPDEDLAAFKSRQRAVYLLYGAIGVDATSNAVDALVTNNALNKQKGANVLDVANQVDVTIREIATAIQSGAFDNKTVIEKIDRGLALLITLQELGVGSITNPESVDTFKIIIELARTGLTALKNFIAIGKPNMQASLSALSGSAKQTKAKLSAAAARGSVLALALLRVLLEAQGKITEASLLDTATDAFMKLGSTVDATLSINKDRIATYTRP